MTCCFVGNLDEVWDHARKVHNVRGIMKSERVDGSIYSEANSEGEWITPPNTKIVTNANGEYLFRCLEGGIRRWRKLRPETAEKLSFSFLWDSVCIETLDSCPDYYSKDDPYMNTDEEKEFLENVRKIYGERGFREVHTKILTNEVHAFLDAMKNK